MAPLPSPSLRGVVPALVAASSLVAAGPLAAQGRWVASDVHLHTTARGCDRDRTPDALFALMGDDGLEVGASLVWGDGIERDRAFFSGEDHPVSTSERLLHYDLEVSAFAADRGGHLILLGLRDLDFSAEMDRSPHSGVPLVDWALGQDPRVVVGVAHGFKWPESGFPDYDSWGRPIEFPVHVARGRAHFLSTETSSQLAAIDAGTWSLWTKLLNSGFRVAIAGGSDLPCINHRLIGSEPRTLVRVDGPLSYDAWLAGLRQGRTVATSDWAERLDLRVGGAGIGDELRARNGQRLDVSIETELAVPGPLELLVNGQPAFLISLPSGASTVSTELRLAASAWVSARTARAQSSPVYVIVDGQPIRVSAEDACFLARFVDYLSGKVASGSIDMAESAPLALAAYAEAREVFLTRFREAGGRSCP